MHALDGFEIALPANEFLCILGASGCGKSTFLRIVAGLAKPTRGQVLLNGQPITGPGLDRGIVFQDPAIFPWLTVIENVEFGLRSSGWSKDAARERAEHVLGIVGLRDYPALFPYQLSGGMKQRVAVARAWALKDAAVLLMDEPFSAVDAILRTKLQDYLVDTWIAEPRTVIYVTHDVDEAVYLADRIAVLQPSPGKVAEYFTIKIDRPRDRNSSEVSALKQRITETLQRIAVEPTTF